MGLDKRQIAESRIDKTNIRNTNINAYIATLTDIATISTRTEKMYKGKIEQTIHKSTLSIRNTIAIYSYLRDEYDAKTVGDALKLLEGGKVDPSAIDGWLVKDMVRKEIAEAIAVGYPEHRKRATDQQYKI